MWVGVSTKMRMCVLVHEPCQVRTYVHTHLCAPPQPPPSYSAVSETTAPDEALLIDLGDEVTTAPPVQIDMLEQELASVG